MTKILTNVHCKLDKLLSRLSALETRTMTDSWRSDAQLRLLARLLAEVQREARDSSTVTIAALKAARESAERIEEILRELRQH
jgi:hypothetical protein